MAKPDAIEIDEELKEGVQQARKKPRFYALVAKGPEVVGLIVQKKIISAGVAQKAKSEFKGNLVVQGVCVGDGPILKFEVLEAEPSINTKKIKEFISERTEITTKPEWSVVTKLSDVADAEADPGAPGEPTEGTAPVDPNAEWKEKLALWGPAIKATIAAKGPTAPDMVKLLAQATSLSKPGGDMPLALSKLAECYALCNLTDLYKERLAAWGPAINAAIAAKGPTAPDIAKLLAQATALSKPGGDTPLALEKLAECHALATAQPTPPDPNAEWKEKLAAWGPAIKAAIEAKGPTAPDIVKLLAQATSLSKPGGDMPLALEKLAECHALATAPPVDPGAQFNDRLKALLPEIKAAAGTPAGDEAKLKASEAGLLARKKDFAGANALLDEVERILQGKTEETPAESVAPPPQSNDRGIPKGTVAKRKFLVERWKRIPPEISADLKKLQAALERDVPDEEPGLLIDLSEEYLNDFYLEMKGAIDTDINAGDGGYKTVLSTIKAFRTRIASEPLIQHLKKNTLKAEVTVEKILLDALTEIEEALAG
ncbi:MAG: hypothetical protein SFU86_10890 [Pirellulaceae bacterium]|nr:hypothetical protein [Pirellulaceae bacterium]